MAERATCCSDSPFWQWTDCVGAKSAGHLPWDLPCLPVLQVHPQSRQVRLSITAKLLHSLSPWLNFVECTASRETSAQTWGTSSIFWWYNSILQFPRSHSPLPAGGVLAGLRGVFCHSEADREDLGAPAGGLAWVM